MADAPRTVRLMFCRAAAGVDVVVVDPPPLAAALDGDDDVDDAPGPASSSFGVLRAGPAGVVLATAVVVFRPGCFDGCFAARASGSVWTAAYSASKRRFMTGSWKTPSSFWRLPLASSRRA